MKDRLEYYSRKKGSLKTEGVSRQEVCSPGNMNRRVHTKFSGFSLSLSQGWSFTSYTILNNRLVTASHIVTNPVPTYCTSRNLLQIAYIYIHRLLLNSGSTPQKGLEQRCWFQDQPGVMGFFCSSFLLARKAANLGIWVAAPVRGELFTETTASLQPPSSPDQSQNALPLGTVERGARGGGNGTHTGSPCCGNHYC